jgi:hypothetical protein
VKTERNLVAISSKTAAKIKFPMSDFIVSFILMSVPSVLLVRGYRTECISFDKILSGRTILYFTTLAL